MSKLHLEQRLIDFAKNGNIVEIQRLMNNGINPAANNNMALWWAASKGRLDILELLLTDWRVSPAARMNVAIAIASENGHTEVVKFLLADVRVNPAENGNIAVHSAARNGHFDVVEMLISDKRVDPSDANNTAIRRASANGHINTAQLLLAYGANIGHRKFDEMYQAAYTGFIGAVSQGAREYLSNKEKVRTIANNHAEIIKNRSLAACASVIRAAHNRKQNQNNVTPLNNVVKHNFTNDWSVLGSVIVAKNADMHVVA
ncbi:MAG: uncharacterized protein K0R98_96 [Rickettsiaceae bacterium]|jgi:ankyrin repeat protein|nr:uncharacterized protein [Rickettsiaceae bacterium]